MEKRSWDVWIEKAYKWKEYKYTTMPGVNKWNNQFWVKDNEMAFQLQNPLQPYKRNLTAAFSTPNFTHNCHALNVDCFIRKTSCWHTVTVIYISSFSDKVWWGDRTCIVEVHVHHVETCLASLPSLPPCQSSHGRDIEREDWSDNTSFFHLCHIINTDYI